MPEYGLRLYAGTNSMDILLAPSCEMLEVRCGDYTKKEDYDGARDFIRSLISNI